MTDQVVLIHGLARTSRSLKHLGHQLQKAGYHPHWLNYPSRHYPIEQLVDDYLAPLLAQLPHDQTIHVVTHSMGGILFRQYCSRYQVPSNLGHVVMLAPPNQGSQIVDKIGHWPLFHWLNGPAGQQLNTNQTGMPKQIGPAQFDLGVIAGSKPLPSWINCFFNEPHDGKVAVKATRLTGMKDHITLPVTHTFMMNHPQVIAQTIHFLNHGHFESNTR
jgi:pimeloyl-ACP methyl ester carboxylesterase